MSDYPKFYRECIVRSRKEHKCCECNGIILFREVYHNFRGIWDDKWETYKTCNDCNELRDRVEEYPPFGDLRSYIFEGYYKPHVQKMIDIMDNRGVRVPTWMRRHLRKCKV